MSSIDYPNLAALSLSVLSPISSLSMILASLRIIIFFKLGERSRWFWDLLTSWSYSDYFSYSWLCIRYLLGSFLNCFSRFSIRSRIVELSASATSLRSMWVQCGLIQNPFLRLPSEVILLFLRTGFSNSACFLIETMPRDIEFHVRTGSSPLTYIFSVFRLIEFIAFIV